MRSMILVSILFAAGCGSAGDGGGGLVREASAASEQVPAIGAAALQAWLTGGSYKTWHCESEVHDARGDSPHGRNRICSNDALSENAGGEYAIDAASVKEEYDSAGTQIVGFAVARKVTAGMGGDGWYWFEGSVSGSPIADGVGARGCVGCHGAAGSNETPGHDFVYTQVR